MLNLLKKASKVIDIHDDIVNKIYNDLDRKVSKEVIVNLISSQSYLAFNLGIKKQLPVRFSKIGSFKIHSKGKRARDIFQYVLSECDGDKVAARKVIKHLRDTNVLETIQI